MVDVLDERDASTCVSLTSSSVNNVGWLTIESILSLFLIFHFCWKRFPSTHMHNGCRWSVRCTSDCRCDWVSNQASSKPKMAAESLTAFSMSIFSKQFKPLTVQYDKNGSELLTITNERNGHLDLLCLYVIVLSYIVCMEKTEFDATDIVVTNDCRWKCAIHHLAWIARLMTKTDEYILMALLFLKCTHLILNRGKISSTVATFCVEQRD